MNEPSDGALPYRTCFVFGSCWPALAGFFAAFGYMLIHMCRSGYFGNSMYEGEPGEWLAIIFPFMIGTLVGLSALGISAILFVVVRPRSRRTAVLIGLLVLPVAVAVGIGIKCLL